MFNRSALRVFLLILLAFQVAFCQQAESSPPNGEAIFVQHCSKCHGETGEGVSAAVSFAGPSLKAEHDHGIVMMRVLVGKGPMPTFANLLSVQQIEAVTAYVTQQIAVIPLTGGDLSEGGKLFRQYCAPCHRTAGIGGALAFTGVNAPDLSGKTAGIVGGAIRSGLGPMPSFPPSVLDDKQLASVVEYVKFMQHPPNPGGSPLHSYGPVAEGFVAWVVMFLLVVVAGWIEKGSKG